MERINTDCKINNNRFMYKNIWFLSALIVLNFISAAQCQDNLDIASDSIKATTISREIEGKGLYLDPNISKKSVHFSFESLINCKDDYEINGYVNMEMDSSKFILSNINLGSIAYIKQAEGQYISSNMLPSTFVALATMASKGKIFSKNKNNWELLELPLLFCFIGEFVHVVSNFKINMSVAKNIKFYIGQNTDYFLFYNPSRISTHSAAGLKIRYKRLSASTEVRIPWTKGYYQNKKPYINFGLGYQFLKI